MLADDPGEVLLRATGRLLPVRPRRDESRQRELRLHRRLGRVELLFPHEAVPLRQQLVRDPHRPAEHLLRRRRQRDVVADRRAHLLAVPAEQERRRQHDLRREPVRLHDLASGQEVVELVGPSELDVRLDRDRVIRLHQGIEELGHGDGLARRESLVEVVALEQARNGGRPREPEHVREVELREPLAVEANLRLRGVDDLERLLLVGARVRIDLLVREDRPLRRAPRRVADPGRVVADDQDADVAVVLEGAHALKRDGAPDVDVRRRHVDSELDAQRPAELQLVLERAAGQHVDRVPRQIRDRHLGESSARSAGGSRSESARCRPRPGSRRPAP